MGPVMHERTRRKVAALVAAMSLAPAMPASARTHTEAIQALIDKATAEFKAGDYAVALIHYEDALRATGDQRLLFMIGRCLEETGRPKEAIDAYERFLIEDAPSDVRERALERLRALRATLAKGRVRVVTPPEATEIRIDGKAIGKGPGVTLEAEVGAHVVEVVVPGQPTVTLHVSVPEAGEVLADATVKGAATASGTDPVVVGASDDGPPEGLSWALLGTGAALAVGGAVLVGVGTGDLSAYEDAEVVDGVAQMTRQRALDLQTRGEALVTSGWTLVGVGGAALVGSAVLLVLEADGPAAVSAAPLDGGGVFVLSGSF